MQLLFHDVLLVKTYEQEVRKAKQRHLCLTGVFIALSLLIDGELYLFKRKQIMNSNRWIIWWQLLHKILADIQDEEKKQDTAL